MKEWAIYTMFLVECITLGMVQQPKARPSEMDAYRAKFQAVVMQAQLPPMDEIRARIWKSEQALRVSVRRDSIVPDIIHQKKTK